MKKILVPYDFSEYSENTLSYGVGLAKELSSELILLNITPFPVITPETGLPAFSYREVMLDTTKELRKVADKIRKEEPLIRHIDCVTEMGDVTETIVEFCKKYSIELVVMGIYQHGSKLMKVLLGSNAVEAAHKIKCPVVIVPPGISYTRPKNIALASDKTQAGTENSALQKAKDLSRLFAAELQVLHVVSEKHHFAPGELVMNNFFEQKEEHQAHKLFIITEKKVSEGLLGMLDNHLIDMILIEPKEHNIFYKLFHESVSKEVAFASPVPVVLIHS